MTIIRITDCLFAGCRSPFRYVEAPETSWMERHLCVMCRDLARLEQFAQSMLRERPTEPERWV